MNVLEPPPRRRDRVTAVQLVGRWFAREVVATRERQRNLRSPGTTSTAKASGSRCCIPEGPPGVLERGYAELSPTIIVDFLTTGPVATIAPVPRPGGIGMQTMRMAWSMPVLNRRARVPALR
jgi:hypothetical protein